MEYHLLENPITYFVLALRTQRSVVGEDHLRP